MKRHWIVEDNYPYFVTGSVVKWLPIFVTPSICDILTDSLRYCRDTRGLRLHAYVIMPTHYHMIVSSEQDLSGIIRDFKRFTSGQIAKAFENIQNPPFENVFRFCGKQNRPPTEHKVWQDGSHPKLIKTEPFFKQKLDYLHANPYRKGLVTDPLPGHIQAFVIMPKPVTDRLKLMGWNGRHQICRDSVSGAIRYRTRSWAIRSQLFLRRSRFLV